MSKFKATSTLIVLFCICGLQNLSFAQERERYSTTKSRFVDDIIYNPYKGQDFVDLKMRAISAIMDRAVEYYNNGDYDSVIRESDNLIEIQSGFAIPYYLKSIAYFKKGDILNAYNFGVKQYQIHDAPKRKEWYDQISEFSGDYLKDLMSENKFSAVKYFCENVWVKNDWSNYYLGLSNYHLGDYKNAKKKLKKLKNVGLANEYLKAIEENRIIPNLFSLKSSSSNSSNNSAEINNNELQNIDKNIDTYYRSKDYEKVLNILQPIEKSIEMGKISDSKIIAYVFERKTYCNYYLKNYAKVISDATMAIKTSDESEVATLYFMRAMSKAELKDYYGSNSDYNYLIDNYGKNGFKENSLGTLLNNKAYNLVLSKDYNSAKLLIDKALSLEKNTDYIWDTKGELEYHLGNYDESIKAMTNSLNLSKSANSYFYRGLANIKLGKKSEGCSDLSKAKELGESKADEHITKYCK